MAKEIVTWCQVDLDDDDRRVPGAEYEVTLAGREFTIDLCPEHHSTHLAPLVTLLDKYGEPVAKATKKTKSSSGASSGASTKYTANDEGMFVCPDPECGREFATAQGIGRHMVSHSN